MQVTYLAHDLDDPSCWRRVDMLRRGGAQVRVAGFRRGDGPLPEPATVLGRTANGRLLQRVRAIMAAAPRIARLIPPPDTAPGAPDSDARGETILARNLEMLALGAGLLRARKAGGAGARLVYELLDIHGIMLGGGAVHRMLRRIEAALMRRASMVVISSPAFAAHYLRAFGQPEIPTLLIENKPFARAAVPDEAARARRGLAEGGPLVVGWFGMLRCAWSLETLDRVTRAEPGRFRVAVLTARRQWQLLVQQAQEFAAQMAVQSVATLAAAEGAVSAYAHATGNTWKPYVPPAAEGQGISRQAATARMNAFE